MQNNEGAEAPTNKMQVKDKEFFINEFNASGKIWDILPKQFDCENITDDCLSCSDGKTNITLCSECDVVMVILESGEPQPFTPFNILIEILNVDPILWLIKEGWITSTSAENQTYFQQIGKVSFFYPPITNTKPAKEITIREVYEYICSEQLKDVTIELREIKKRDERKFKLEKKKRLPSVTFSGTFTIRNGSNQKELSRCMCFDIDHVNNIDGVISSLLGDENLGIVLLFISPGGDGVKLVLKSPEGISYTEVYQNIREYLKITHNIDADPTQDISRACFLCHDPNAYINEAAPPTLLPISSLPVSLKPLSRSDSNERTVSKTSNVATDCEKVDAYISALEAQAVDISVIYDDWIKLGFSFASLGETGRSLFHRLSKIHPEYSYDEADKKFTNLLHSAKGHVSLGTFFYYCHKMDVRPSKSMPFNHTASSLRTTVSGESQAIIKPYVSENGAMVKGNQKVDQAPEEIDWEEVLRKHQINPTDEIPIPPTAWKYGQTICGTLGEFSLLIGKAKSRKSFFVGLLVAGILNPEDPENPFSGELPIGKQKVIYIDTEQSKYHVQRAINRIRTLIGEKVNSSQLIVYALRPLSPKERMAAIDYAITTTTGLGLVVIDGIADLQTDINNPDQAVMVATSLLRWTEIHHIHIITVLHENKGDRNARGHLGTEMVNKAETTLSITKDSKNPNISIVEPEYCRSIAPDPFAFEINEQGLPVESLEYSMRQGKTVKADNLADSAIAEIFKNVFARNEKVSYTSLWQGVKLAYHNLYSGNLADNQAKALVEKAKYDGIICQERQRGPYSLVHGKG